MYKKDSKFPTREKRIASYHKRTNMISKRRRDIIVSPQEPTISQEVIDTHAHAKETIRKEG
jgi:hypothetical protein